MVADPDQGQELQHQPVGRRRSCALALVAADAGPLPAKGVGSRHAGTQCLRAIFNCASFRWEWWQIPTKARSCSTSPLGGAGAALSLSSQPTRVLYRRRELARGRRSQHMRCARKISRRMTILQLKAGRHGIYMCILHAIFICKKEQGRGGKEEERKGERRAEDTTRAKSRQRRGRWPGGGGGAAAPAAGGGCAFFSSSAWLYRIKASRSRTLLSAFTQAAEKRAVSRVFLVWFGFAVVGFSLL